MTLNNERSHEIPRYDWGVLKCALRKSNSIPRDLVDEAISELEKFFCLISETDQPLAVVGKIIDDAWHQFLLCSEEYEKFCRAHFGRYIHHRVNTRLTPVPAIAVRNMVANYRRKFGELPAIWFLGMEDYVERYISAKADSLPENGRWSGWPGNSTSK